MCIWESAFQAEGIASAKALGQELAWLGRRTAVGPDHELCPPAPGGQEGPTGYPVLPSHNDNVFGSP